MLTIPDGWRTRLSWATWSYPNRWLPASVYEDDLAVLAITSFVKHWQHNVESFSKSLGYVEHLLLTIGLISRDIYSYQFSNQDPDDVDNTPPYCNSDRLNLSYHDELMKLVGTVYEHAQTHTLRKLYLMVFCAASCSLTPATEASTEADNTRGSNETGATSTKPKRKRQRPAHATADPAVEPGALEVYPSVTMSYTDMLDPDTALANAVRKPKPRPRKRVRIEADETSDANGPGGGPTTGGAEREANSAQGGENIQ